MVIDHERSELPKGNFPAKPFFGVKPVIVDPELVSHFFVGMCCLDSCGNFAERCE